MIVIGKIIFIVIIVTGLIFLLKDIAIHLDPKEEEEAPDKMWEIFVPASSNDQEFTYDHHKKWDDYVKSLAGGLTIMKTAKGEWIDSSTDKVYKDRIIPVRIKCSKKNIKKIIEFTITHYNQEAVLAYKVSDKVYLIYKK